MLALLIFFPVHEVHSSGFAIYTQGADSLGQGNSVTAHLQSPSAIFINPALINKLEGTSFGEPLDEDSERLLIKAMKDRIKFEEDMVSRQLMQLRLEEEEVTEKDIIDELAEKRLALRRLGWRTDFRDLSPSEEILLKSLLQITLTLLKMKSECGGPQRRF